VTTNVALFVLAAVLERLRGAKGLFAYELGVIRVALGEQDQAFRWFKRAIQKRIGLDCVSAR
jgi:hypothetical protein